MSYTTNPRWKSATAMSLGPKKTRSIVRKKEKRDLHFKQEETQDFLKRNPAPMTDGSRKIFAHKQGRVLQPREGGNNKRKEGKSFPMKGGGLEENQRGELNPKGTLPPRQTRQPEWWGRERRPRTPSSPERPRSRGIHTNGEEPTYPYGFLGYSVRSTYVL